MAWVLGKAVIQSRCEAFVVDIKVTDLVVDENAFTSRAIAGGPGVGWLDDKLGIELS